MNQIDTSIEKLQRQDKFSFLYQRIKSLEEENQQLKRELYVKIRQMEGLEPWRIPDARSNPRKHPRPPRAEGAEYR